MTITDMALPDAVVDAAVHAGCTAADIHLSCSFPHCSCKQMPKAVPAAIRAALQAMIDCGMARMAQSITTREYKHWEAHSAWDSKHSAFHPAIIIRLDSDERKPEEQT